MKNFYKHELLTSSSSEKKRIIKIGDSPPYSPNNVISTSAESIARFRYSDQDSYLKYLSSLIYEIQLKKFYGDIFELAQKHTNKRNVSFKFSKSKSQRIKSINSKNITNSLELIPVMLVFCLNLIFVNITYAQESDTTLKSKVNSVGQVIPKDIWDKTLILFNHPQGKEASRLKDYKHKKLIIIDFWSTWCGTCLFTMPRTYDKIAPYTDSIELMPVTTQSIETIQPIWKISKYLQSIPDFYSVVNEHYLKELFAIPHYPIAIIINREGEILFYDKPSKITDELLHNLLDREESI